MKRGKDIKIKWKDLIPEIPNGKPEGYSTAGEISKRVNMATETVRQKLREARERGEIEAIQVKVNKKVVWAYKD